LNPATKQEIDRRLAEIDKKLAGGGAAEAATPGVVAPKSDPAQVSKLNVAVAKYNKAQGLMRAKDYENALTLFTEVKTDLDSLPANAVAASDRTALDANMTTCKDAMKAATAPMEKAPAKPVETVVAQADTAPAPAEPAPAPAPAPAETTPAPAPAPAPVETTPAPAVEPKATLKPAVDVAPAVPPKEEAAGVFKDAVTADEVRIQLEEQEIRTKLADGMVFLRERDFRRAEQKFLAAQLQVKYGDFSTEFKVRWLAEVQRYLDLVASTQQEFNRTTGEVKNQEATVELQRHIEEMKVQQMRLKARLAEQFDTFYHRGQYDDALLVLARMHDLDPEDASIPEKIKQTTAKKLQIWAHDSKTARNQAEEEQYTALQEQMTAWYPISKYPDNWKELSDRRLRRMEKTNITEKPQDRKVRQQLDETIVSFTFNEQSVMEAIDFLQTLGNVNIVPDRTKFEDPAKTVTLKLQNVPLATAIKLLTEQLGLKWTVRDGIVFISDAEGIKRPPETNTYDVRDLLADIPNFEGPTFELQNISSNSGRGGSGGSGGSSSSIFSSDTSGSKKEEGGKSAEESLNDLIDLVKQVVEAGTWDEGSGNAIRGRAGNVIVTHTPETQAKVQKLLEDLRKTRALQVSIDIRFITLSDAFLESMGFDFTGAGNPAASPPFYIDTNGDGTPDAAMGVQYDRTISGGDWTFLGTAINALGGATGLGTAKGLTGDGGLTLSGSFLNDVEVNFILTAVQQSRRSTLLNSPRLTMMNGQRAYIAVSRQQNFVQSVTAEVSEGAVGYTPEIGTVQDGIVFDVRPTVSADRRYVQMDLRPSVAVIERIDNFNTIVAGVFGGAVVQLPVIDVTVVRATVSVPDGGTLLIGGLNYAFDSETESGVPILSKIPLLGKLFSRRGFTTERQNVVILVKPTIIIQEEKEEELK
jgi:type II secretory pathway component GspD/PulD (secretin)